jgi:protein-S-isoprenylcysteine O-methyltransferase Ste14
MIGESTYHTLFWMLLGLVMLMRVYFTIQVLRAGERVMPDQAAIQREGKAIFAARVVAFFLLGVLLVFYALSSPWIMWLAIPLPGWLRWTGFILGLVSLGLWTWTQVALGKAWSPQLQLREGHHLVTSGPYTRVRHPLYTAMFGFTISLALVAANWIFVAFGALMIVGIYVRVPHEEQMMLAEFGEEYQAYMQRTGRLFPKR